jgi:hypothetical protein
LIALSSTERWSVPKVSDGTLSFVEKALDYARQDGKLLPQFIELEEMEKEWRIVHATIWRS